MFERDSENATGSILNAYLGPWQISMIELFCKNSDPLLAVYYFYKKPPS